MSPAPRLVVFSDDWGRHPSSCQHLIAELLPRYRVDWINTIGTRRPTLSRHDLARAMDHLERLLQPLRRIEHESRPLLKAWLEETEGVHSTFADHGIIAFPELEGVDDTLEFARFLAAKHQVDVVPGEYFGVKRHVRVGCGVPAETLREGLARFSEGLRSWRAGKRNA